MFYHVVLYPEQGLNLYAFALDFKSNVSTNFTTGASRKLKGIRSLRSLTGPMRHIIATR